MLSESSSRPGASDPQPTARLFPGFTPAISEDSPSISASTGLREIALAQAAALIVWLNVGGLPLLGSVLLIALALFSWWRWFGVRRLARTSRSVTDLADRSLSLSVAISWIEVATASLTAICLMFAPNDWALQVLVWAYPCWAAALWIQGMLTCCFALTISHWLELGIVRWTLRAALVTLAVAPLLLMPRTYLASNSSASIALAALGIPLALLGTWALWDALQRLAVALPQVESLQGGPACHVNEVVINHRPATTSAEAQSDEPIPLD